MGLLSNLSGNQETMSFSCKKCGTVFTAESSKYRKVVYPIYADHQITCCFANCPECESQVALKCS